MADVIGLHGRSAPLDNGADPDVIDVLERYLGMAREGRLRAIGVIAVEGNGKIWTKAAGVGHKHELVAGTVYLQSDIAVSTW